MADFSAHKVLDALPSPLEPNAIYAVRTGGGFDLYITTEDGLFAHKVNPGDGARIHVGPTAPSDTTMLWVDTT